MIVSTYLDDIKIRMEYLDSLKNLGLDEREQTIYLSLLQMEKASAGQIAKKTDLKRSTVYNALYRLLSGGFVSEVEVRNTKIFIATPPNKLENMLENKKRDLKHDLPYLLSVYNTKPMKPKVSYFYGLSGIKQLYEDILTTLGKGDEILAYVIDESAKVLTPELIDLGTKKRVEKGIRLRAIYQKTDTGYPLLASSANELREVRMIADNEHKLENEINIYKNKVLIVNYAPEAFGILIESKETANTERALFEMHWAGLTN